MVQGNSDLVRHLLASPREVWCADRQAGTGPPACPLRQPNVLHVCAVPQQTAVAQEQSTASRTRAKLILLTCSLALIRRRQGQTSILGERVENEFLLSCEIGREKFHEEKKNETPSDCLPRTDGSTSEFG